MSQRDMLPSISALRSICNTAQKIRNLTESHLTRTVPRKSPDTFPGLRLSFPEEVLSTLKSMNLPNSIYSGVEERLLGWYQQMQATHRQHYIQTCQRLGSVNSHVKNDSIFENVRLAFEHSFSKRYVPLIASHVQSMKEIYQCKNPRNRKGRKHPFQQAFVPLLEQYFDLNAYPSASDRALLASKTMNTPRQIEVWFQNHRSRAKKDRKILKRSDSPSIIRELFSSYNPPVDSDATSSDQYTPSEEDESDPEYPNAPASKENVLDLLDPPRPAHAFPTPFSKRSEFDPFRDMTVFPPLTWPRQPASGPSHPEHSVDFDAFVSDFAQKLDLGDKSPKKLPLRSHKRRPVSNKPWFSSTVVFAPKAPLPSLVRTSPYVHSYRCDQLLTSDTLHTPPLRNRCKPQLWTQNRLRIPSNVSSTYPSWSSRSSSLSSISSAEPVTPPRSPAIENLNLKNAGVDYDYNVLQEIMGLSANFGDPIQFVDNHNQEFAPSQFSHSISATYFGQ